MSLFQWMMLLLLPFCLSCGELISPGSRDLESAASSSNQFALDLYRQYPSNENLFFSPASISTTLAMIYAGADGETRAEMQRVLHLLEDEGAVHQGFSDLLNALNNAEEVQLSVANRLWAQHNYTFAPGFLSLVNASYGAPATLVDFSRTQAALDEINTWVEENTGGKIKDLLQPGDIDSLTRLVLTNAIYFKGDWNLQFNEDATQPGEFTLADGSTVSVPMMRQTSEFLFSEYEGVKVLEMPYKGEKHSMVFILPESADGLPALESDMTAEKLSELLAGTGQRKVRVQIPKFKMEIRSQLNEMLIQLGMETAFSDAKADFSRMTGSRDLFLSAVIHKAFIEVNEEGSEAAAATAGVMKLRSAAPQRIPHFHADRPFIFLIKDRQSGAVLFMGRMSDPS